MKKKLLIFHILYYILFLLFYIGFFFVSARLLKTNDLAAAVGRAGILVFVLTPAIILLFTRFSLLRWYVDPIAAAIVPLFFYLYLLINQWKHTDSLKAAFFEINGALADSSVTGWGLLIVLFLFGLLASFSPARKEGRSICYRLIAKTNAK